MAQTEHGQVVRRGMFQGIFYSMSKSFFDKIDVEINGNRPGDVQVNDEEFYYRLFKYATGMDRLSLGESYMDGQWECDLIAFFEKALHVKRKTVKGSKYIAKIVHMLPVLLFNLQTKILSKQNISAHYDIGNDLFNMMLDRAMNYSCGYWEKNVCLDPLDANNSCNLKTNSAQLCETLDEAQLNKMVLIGRKLNLKPKMKVLDIGCGWGYLAKFLAVNFDVHVIGITISKKQYEYATTTDLEPEELEFLRIPSLNPKGTGKFEFRFQDYRDIDETFDRIVSVGMFEHVGVKNYNEFFEVTKKILKYDGLFLLHTIGISHHYLIQSEPWTEKYIFPGGMIPYHKQIIDAFYGKFIMEDLHNFGYSYFRTLIEWHKNFLKSWPKLEAKYGERFKRMWVYYLQYSAALFKTRKLALWQIVLSRDGYPGGYVSYR